MNICIFNFEHVSKTRGGTERVTSILSNAYKAQGHNVYMVSVCPPVSNDTLKDNQFILPENGINTKTNIDFVRNLLAEKKIDIILNQAVPKEVLDLIVSTQPSAPIITCIHTHPFIVMKSITDFWDRKKMRNGWKFILFYPIIYMIFLYFKRSARKSTKEHLLHCYKNSDAIVLLSNKYKKCFTDLLGNIDTSKLYAIPNPKEQKNKTIDIKEKTVIFVGRQVFQKRVDRLLFVWKKVFKKHADWKLQIIGDGDEKDLFKQLAEKLNLKNIEFIGLTAPEEYYRKASILCMTSSHEGLPMVLLEAQQYNVIPIAFNSFESSTDIIENKKNGFLIKPFSIKEYARIMDMLMSDADYRKKIHTNIQHNIYTDSFDKNNITEQWERLFNILTTSNKASKN